MTTHGSSEQSPILCYARGVSRALEDAEHGGGDGGRTKTVILMPGDTSAAVSPTMRLGMQRIDVSASMSIYVCMHMIMKGYGPCIKARTRITMLWRASLGCRISVGRMGPGTTTVKARAKSRSVADGTFAPGAF
jgi:hypothetical protein